MSGGGESDMLHEVLAQISIKPYFGSNCQTSPCLRLHLIYRVVVDAAHVFAHPGVHVRCTASPVYRFIAQDVLTYSALGT